MIERKVLYILYLDMRNNLAQLGLGPKIAEIIPNPDCCEKVKIVIINI
jgi:hypothetical protein